MTLFITQIIGETVEPDGIDAGLKRRTVRPDFVGARIRLRGGRGGGISGHVVGPYRVTAMISAATVPTPETMGPRIVAHWLAAAGSSAGTSTSLPGPGSG